jgi:drug/metabolite transporter (DMT)-like permease
MTPDRFDQRTLLGVLLLFVCGLLWGAMPMLSKLAVGVHANPVGLSLMVNLYGAVTCLVLCWWRGLLQWPRFADLGFFVIWALLYSVLNQVLIYWLSMHLDAAVVSIFTVLEGLFIFVAAAVLRLEQPSTRRCIGLMTGLLGMAFLFAAGQFGTTRMTSMFLLVGLIIPLSYAAESIYIAARRPEAVNPLMAIALVMTCSLPMLFVLAWLTDDFMPVQFPPGRAELWTVLIMAATLLANLAYFVLIKISGPVFSGQVSYFSALCGVGWGVAILGERVSWSMLLALALIMAGLMLVRPAQQSQGIKQAEDLQPWPAE